MKRFRFRALTLEGTTRRGHLTAASQPAANLELVPGPGRATLAPELAATASPALQVL